MAKKIELKPKSVAPAIEQDEVKEQIKVEAKAPKAEEKSILLQIEELKTSIKKNPKMSGYRKDAIIRDLRAIERKCSLQ